MKLQLRSPVLLDFEDTRPAPHFGCDTLVRPPSAPTRATARPPLPQDSWLRELPLVAGSSALAWPERRAPHWLRVAGLAAAALLALFALGLAASLLDAQRSDRGADGREHLAARV
jgi:hypothetical protein